jgi:hypothetical protein
MKPNLISFLPSRQILLGAVCLAAALAAFPVAAQSRANRVALNPQPLPPRSQPAAGRVDNSLQQRGIIIVGGRAGAVSLNPQPLPPKAGGR